ncbi:MAG: hypothetical protein ACTSXH_02135 [Promethearchaeota archaeon]
MILFKIFSNIYDMLMNIVYRSLSSCLLYEFHSLQAALRKVFLVRSNVS